jgi:HNH endonuclease
MLRSNRKPIPGAITRQVLIEAGYQCGVPTCRNILAIDLHHIVEVSEGGGNEAANLLALCPTCHALYHRGTYSREAIYAWKQVLVSLSAAFDLETIDLMLFLYKMRDDPRFIIRQDALLQFARLIGNDLAVFEWKQDTINNMIFIGYRVSLSQKGQHLIEAWRKGDRNAVAEAMSPGVPLDAQRTAT